MDRNLLIHIRAGVYGVFRDSKLNWNYQSGPEAALAGRRVDAPRGKVFGGSSSINSMVYMRGHPLDYGAWAGELGLDGWSYAVCLPYFRAGETSDRGANVWRGGDAPLGVTKGGGANLLPRCVRGSRGTSRAGALRRPERLSPRRRGANGCHQTRWAQIQCSRGAFGTGPGRPTLTLKTSVMVRRIIMDGLRAAGSR